MRVWCGVVHPEATMCWTVWTRVGVCVAVARLQGHTAYCKLKQYILEGLYLFISATFSYVPVCPSQAVDTDVLLMDDFYWWMKQPDYQGEEGAAGREGTGAGY